jgi:Amt family ammonium transporter
LGWQLVRQLGAVGVAIAWSGAGSTLCFVAVKLLVPLRHARDAEREGLDIADHGERAYNY